MKTTNLFGEIVEIDFTIPKGHKSKYQLWKQRNNYVKKNVTAISCKTCDHHRIFNYHNKIYHKCELLGISNSEATDIRVGHVCNKWEVEDALV